MHCIYVSIAYYIIILVWHSPATFSTRLFSIYLLKYVNSFSIWKAGKATDLGGATLDSRNAINLEQLGHIMSTLPIVMVILIWSRLYHW